MFSCHLVYEMSENNRNEKFYLTFLMMHSRKNRTKTFSINSDTAIFWINDPVVWLSRQMLMNWKLIISQ